MSEDLKLHAKTTALILIDLQQGTAGRALAPYPGAEVVRQGARLAEAFRKAGGTVVYVNVNVHEILRLPADHTMGRDPNAPPAPKEASELVQEAGYQEGDLRVTKRQWGAFYGTDLEQQLLRRGIKTIVLGGIATNLGVESTARAAFELVFVEDAMTSISVEAHRFATTIVFPIMGRVRAVGEVISALV